MKHSKIFKVLGFAHVAFCLKSQDIWTPTSGPRGLVAQELIHTVDNRLVLSAIQSGIFISDDEGNTWRKVYKGLKEVNDYADDLAAAPDSTIYAVVRRIKSTVETELYRLDYGSDEWIKLPIHLIGRARIVATESGYVFLVGLGQATLAYSLNKGMSFDTILYDKNVSIFTYSINGNGNNYVAIPGPLCTSLYKINDNGSNLKMIYCGDVNHLLWHPAGYLLVNNNVMYDSYRFDHLNQIDTIELPKPGVGNWFLTPDFKIMASTGIADYVSDDFGASWSMSNTNLYKRVGKPNIFFLHDTILYRSESCHGSELAKTADYGVNWISFDDKFENPDEQTIFFDPSGNLFSQTCSNGFAVSTDYGFQWNSINMPLPEYASTNDLVSTRNGNMFLRTNASIFKSIDKGLNWAEIMHYGNYEFRKLAYDGNQTIYLFGKKSSLVSRDLGVNWSLISQSFGLDVDKVFFHPDGSIYLLMENVPDPSIFYSADAGQTWSTINHNFQFIITMAFSGNGSIYISGLPNGAGYGFYESDDKLKTFKFLAEKTFNSLVIDDQDVIYGVLNGGTCERSTNGGIDWEAFSSGLPTNKIFSIALDKNQFLYAGVAYGKVYKTIDPVAKPTGSFDSDKENQVMIYPNPANNKISIKIPDPLFSLETNWTLTDLTGRSILHGKIRAKQFSFNTEGIQNGIYFLKINQLGIPARKVIVQH